jgi:hypothetical protein
MLLATRLNLVGGSHVDCRIAVVVVVGAGGAGGGDRAIHRRSSNTVYLFDVCE